MTQADRLIKIGMPQMAGGCLSENWLLKELGGFHWDYLCNSLRCKSHELADKEGRRLYATFVRVRLNLEGTIGDFYENDALHLSIEMSRFGRSTLLSTIRLKSNTAVGTATLMSTFSFRTQENNTSLAKSEPAVDYDSSITQLSGPPGFFSEYSDVRKRFFSKRNDKKVSTVYQINPFTDSNGANLLYFASYQSIHDFLTFLNLSSFHTKKRDIFYFRNCDLDDKIVALPASESLRSSTRVERGDLLFRNSDNSCIAYVVTAKEH